MPIFIHQFPLHLFRLIRNLTCGQLCLFGSLITLVWRFKVHARVILMNTQYSALPTLRYYVFVDVKTQIQSSQLWHSIVLPGVTIIFEELTGSLLSMMEASGNHLPRYMMLWSIRPVLIQMCYENIEQMYVITADVFNIQQLKLLMYWWTSIWNSYLKLSMATENHIYVEEWKIFGCKCLL